jgi:hypothetical protein
MVRRARPYLACTGGDLDRARAPLSPPPPSVGHGVRAPAQSRGRAARRSRSAVVDPPLTIVWEAIAWEANVQKANGGSRLDMSR